MAELIIRLLCADTGGKEIVVSLRSDEDAPPQEHERHHRTLVDGLVQGGTLQAAEEGRLVVGRTEVLLPTILTGG
jgi:hypothetical protein